MNLLYWLRSNPQPHAVRYTTADEEERVLQLSSTGRNKWKKTAEALEQLGAVRVECLASDGNVLRVTTLAGDDDGSEAGARGPAADDKRSAKEMTALAAILDAQGKRISEAFDKGAEAANTGQANLLEVVQVMTAQWSLTMQSLHNVSMNLASVILKAGGGDGEVADTNGAALQQLMGAMFAKMMGAGMPPPGADTPPKANGKKG